MRKVQFPVGIEGAGLDCPRDLDCRTLVSLPVIRAAGDQNVDIAAVRLPLPPPSDLPNRRARRHPRPPPTHRSPVVYRSHLKNCSRYSRNPQPRRPQPATSAVPQILPVSSPASCPCVRANARFPEL